MEFPSYLYFNIWTLLICIPILIVLIFAHIYVTLKKAGKQFEIQMRLAEEGGLLSDVDMVEVDGEGIL